MQKGFITLYSIIILGSVGLALALMLGQSSVWETKSARGSLSSAQSRKISDACAEVGLQAIHDNTNYTGTANQSLGTGSCSYTVTDTGGSTRSLTTIATVGTIYRKTTISIGALSPSITVSSWQEVP